VSPLPASKGVGRKKMPFSQRIAPAIRAYTLPQLTQGKSYWYISFYAFDPAEGKMRRKRIRVTPRIQNSRDRKRYAQDLMHRITQELECGWNPWLEYQGAEAYQTWQEVCDSYRHELARLKADDMLRHKTVYGYLSMLDQLCKWAEAQPKPLTYIYQLDQRMVSRFVDWLWLDRGLSVRTRDNYVTWLHVFGSWLVAKGYSDKDPSQAVKYLAGKKSKSGKNRTVIPQEKMLQLRDWCLQNNRHYLLACHLIYYCFIRPNEISHIQLKHISVRTGTIFIPDYSSKNGKDGTVTLPDCVLKFMIDLGVFSHPDSYYLFSKRMLPGEQHCSAKQFSDFWTHRIRKELGWPLSLKFYSLKDTGITDLIKDHADLLTVRNQARHHSLLMTDIYTPHDIEEANQVIKTRRTEF